MNLALKAGLTPEIKEAQPHALLKTLAKNAKSFHYTENFFYIHKKSSIEG
jgi:hypothetical protein